MQVYNGGLGTEFICEVDKLES